MSNEEYGRFPIAQSRNPYTCGLTGKTYTTAEVIQREDYLARAIGHELRLDPVEGTEWDKVIGLFSLNTVGNTLFDPYCSATHLPRLTTCHSPTPSTCSMESSRPPAPPTRPLSSNIS